MYSLLVCIFSIILFFILSIFLLKNIFFSHTIYTDHSFPSLHSFKILPPTLLSQIYSFSVSIQKKKAGLQQKTAKHSKTRYNKTRQKSLYQGWMRKSDRRKNVPRACRMFRDTSAPTLSRHKLYTS